MENRYGMIWNLSYKIKTAIVIFIIISIFASAKLPYSQIGMDLSVDGLFKTDVLWSGSTMVIANIGLYDSELTMNIPRLGIVQGKIGISSELFNGDDMSIKIGSSKASFQLLSKNKIEAVRLLYTSYTFFTASSPGTKEYPFERYKWSSAKPYREILSSLVDSGYVTDDGEQPSGSVGMSGARLELVSLPLLSRLDIFIGRISGVGSGVDDDATLFVYGGIGKKIQKNNFGLHFAYNRFDDDEDKVPELDNKVFALTGDLKLPGLGVNVVTEAAMAILELGEYAAEWERVYDFAWIGDFAVKIPKMRNLSLNLNLHYFGADFFAVSSGLRQDCSLSENPDNATYNYEGLNIIDGRKSMTQNRVGGNVELLSLQKRKNMKFLYGFDASLKNPSDYFYIPYNVAKQEMVDYLGTTAVEKNLGFLKNPGSFLGHKSPGNKSIGRVLVLTNADKPDLEQVFVHYTSIGHNVMKRIGKFPLKVMLSYDTRFVTDTSSLMVFGHIAEAGLGLDISMKSTVFFDFALQHFKTDNIPRDVHDLNYRLGLGINVGIAKNCVAFIRYQYLGVYNIVDDNGTTGINNIRIEFMYKE
jgi:hypothetical protein